MKRRGAIGAVLASLLWGGTAFAAPGQDRFFATSDGVRLHYIEAGRGHTIVLVPGWTMPAWIWVAQIADLSRSYRVIAFDPRSQGESQAAASGHDQDRRGADIAELIAHLGPEPVLLVGWSLGVLDSLAYIHRYGDSRVAGLVLVDNSVGEDPPPSGGGAPRGGKRLSRAASMRAFVRGMFARPHPEAYLDRLTQAALRTPERAAHQLLAYPVPRSYWKEAVYSTAKPVFYIVRPGFAGQAANLAAHHPSAETVVVSDLGHAMFVDDPARFDAMLLDFIRRRVWR